MAIFALIPFLPLLASFIIVLGGQRWGERSHTIGIPALGISFGLSVGAFIEVWINGPITLSLYRLIESGNLVIELGLYIDQLSVLLLLLVSGVSSVVHVYSSRYMIGDPRYNRFFAVISFFTFAMLLLVISRNLLMLYVCWEVMGLCSYLLISHWRERSAACQAATKAFLTNAVADVGFGLGVILTFATFGTLDIPQILEQAPMMSGHTINLLGWIGLNLPVQSVTLITLCLFMGAMGKSAQMPFHVWLPFAMEAPTPVSALIHAATMVNAGPFLLVRLSPLVMVSPVAMTIIAIIGATTALFAGIVSLTQSDIKKILAYSTISQIGFMIMACGLGAFIAAIFHLLAHGCYKAFFFLSTGNALRSVEPAHEPPGQEETLRRSQGMWLLYGGALALACIPPFILFSGPYERLWGATGFTSANIGFWIIGLATVFVTANYLFRGVTSLFLNGPKIPRSMSVPDHSQRIQPQFAKGSILIGILLMTVVVAGLLTMLWGWFVDFLAPVFTLPGVSPVEGNVENGFSYWILLPVGSAILGWLYAYTHHVHPRRKGPGIVTWSNSLYMWFWNKGYFDEIYDAYIIQPNLRLASWLWQVIDIRCIDRAIMGLGTVTIALAGWLWRVVDLRGIDRAVVGVGQGSVGLAGWLWRVVDLRGIDRAVVGVGHKSLGLADWLWRIVDIRGIDQNVERVGRIADTSGHKLQAVEPRTLQHHLLVIIFWLVLAILLYYWLVL